MSTKTTQLLLIGALVVLIVGALVGGYWLLPKTAVPEPPTKAPEPIVETPAELPWQTMTVIGSSVEGRAIEAHTYGTGDVDILFVGGIHGGYEWNSSLLAYEVMDYIASNTDVLPRDVTVHVIPVLNPDGMYEVVGKESRFTKADIQNPAERVATARFNARDVDLNRNFDCKWQPQSTWRGQAVSAGTSAFSEPEAMALRDYITKIQPKAVVFWHSQANNVYASECENGILPDTLKLMNTYASASGYGAVSTFDAYPVTGDAEGWLASIGIPAVTVELKSFSDSEFTQNWAGVVATMKLFVPSQ